MVNTEIKTRITVYAVELHIPRAHAVAALKICRANFGEYNLEFHIMWILRTTICSFHCNQYTILLLILLSFALFVKIMNFFVNNEHFSGSFWGIRAVNANLWLSFPWPYLQSFLPMVASLTASLVNRKTSTNLSSNIKSHDFNRTNIYSIQIRLFQNVFNWIFFKLLLSIDMIIKLCKCRLLLRLANAK